MFGKYILQLYVVQLLQASIFILMTIMAVLIGNQQRKRVLVYSFIITQTNVVFEQNVDAINISWSTNIYFPPQCLVRSDPSYFICSHARHYVFIHCVVCTIVSASKCVRLSCGLVIR